MKKIKILHVLTSPRAEGTPRIVLDWLQNSNTIQSVLFLNEKPADWISAFKETECQVFTNPETGTGLAKIIRIIKIVRKTSKQVKPDLLISWNQGNAHYVLTGGRFAGVKKLIVHAGCAPEYKGFFHWFYNLYVYYPIKLFDGCVICASEYIRDEFKKILLFPNSILFTISNSFSFARFNSQRESGHSGIAVNVGNLEKVKSQDLLLSAWSELIKMGIKKNLWIAGGGSQRSMLEKLIKDYELDHWVQLLGPVNNIPDILNKAELFIFTSGNQEGFGTVLLEALSSGLKVVSVDIPASREILKNGEYGILINSRDPIDIAYAIKEAFENPISEIQKQKNIEYASSFTPERMMREYLSVVGLDERIKNNT